MTATAAHCAVYTGVVRHRRFAGPGHRFAVGVALFYLDVDEIGEAFAGRWLWSARRPALVRFRRADYFGPAAVPLGDAVRDAVARRLGRRPEGPVRMLTSLRAFGRVFNPVTFYFCFDRAEALVAVLAEITNTPWGERHHYVVAAGGSGARRRAVGRFRKEFHVSPFQPFAQDYVWRFSAPGERLAVHMENRGAGGRQFDATLVLRRRPWTTGALWRAWLRNPLQGIATLAVIYWHALRLWLRRAPFHAHPARKENA